MKSPYLVLLSLLVLCGCGRKPAEPSSLEVSPRRTATAPVGGNSGDTVTPIGPNVGPTTPMAGGENLGGGTGGGLGQRAKDMARNAASQSSQAPTNTGDDAGGQ